MSIIEYTGHIIATSTSLPLPSKSEVNAIAVVGASITGVHVVPLILVALFITCMFKRRKLQYMQSKEQRTKSDAVFQNTTYDDFAVTNQKQDVKYANTTLENDNQGIICKIDDIYVGEEKEYNHL